MPRKIVLVGHCGPDSSYLRMAVSRSVREAQILMADDQRELDELLAGGVDLLLLNRVLDYGFEQTEGVELIRQLRAAHPQLRVMLVSNYPEAQAQALAAGALAGFGKREIGSPRVTELLRAAMAEGSTATSA